MVITSWQKEKLIKIFIIGTKKKFKDQRIRLKIHNFLLASRYLLSCNPPFYTSFFYRPMGHDFIPETNVFSHLDIETIFANRSGAPTIEGHKYLLLKYTPISRRTPHSRSQDLQDISHDSRDMSEISSLRMILFLEYPEMEIFL